MHSRSLILVLIYVGMGGITRYRTKRGWGDLANELPSSLRTNERKVQLKPSISSLAQSSSTHLVVYYRSRIEWHIGEAIIVNDETVIGAVESPVMMEMRNNGLLGSIVVSSSQYTKTTGGLATPVSFTDKSMGSVGACSLGCSDLQKQIGMLPHQKGSTLWYVAPSQPIPACTACLSSEPKSTCCLKRTIYLTHVNNIQCFPRTVTHWGKPRLSTEAEKKSGCLVCYAATHNPASYHKL